MKDKVLLIEDDHELGNSIKVILENEGFEVHLWSSGEEGLKAFDDSFNIVILDVMLPGISGLDVCKEIRKQSDIPVLFLTGKSEDSDKVAGFTSGADDYLTKPFSYIELTVRIKALVRRYEMYRSNQCLEANEIKIDRIKDEVYKNGHRIKMTQLEKQLLNYLMTHKNEVISIKQIYENVWHDHFHSSSHNTVMVHIRSLRQKIEDHPDDPQYIKTVWGKGYEFEADE